MLVQWTNIPPKGGTRAEGAGEEIAERRLKKLYPKPPGF